MSYNSESMGQEFIADLYIHKELQSYILTAGFRCVLRINDVDYEGIEILELIHKIDPKTNQLLNKKKPVFVVHGDRVICRIQANTWAGNEKLYDLQPSDQRFILHTMAGEEFGELKVMEPDEVNNFDTQPIFASST